MRGQCERSDGSAEAMAAVTEGSVVVRAGLVQTGSCRRWCGSVRQGTEEAQGSPTAAAEAAKRKATAGMAQEDTGEGRRWCE